MKILRNEELSKTRSFLVARMAYTSDPNTKFHRQDFTGIINKADGSKTVLDHPFSPGDEDEEAEDEGGTGGKKNNRDSGMIEKGFYISYVGNGFSFHSSFFRFHLLLFFCFSSRKSFPVSPPGLSPREGNPTMSPPPRQPKTVRIIKNRF